MRLFCLVVMAAAVFAGDPQTRRIEVNRNDTVIPQVVGGGYWSTTITLVNLDPMAATVTLRFYGGDGQPKAFELVGKGTLAVVTGTIPVGGSITITTASGPAIPEAQGWAELVTDNDIGGMAVFCQAVPGRPDFEAVVPITSKYDTRVLFPFDNTGGLTTSYAIVNPISIASATVRVAIRDENGASLGAYSLSLDPREHVAFTSKERWPVTENRRGVIELSTTGVGLSALGLRFNDGGAFTSFHGLSAFGW